jgi:hypothetical protein
MTSKREQAEKAFRALAAQLPESLGSGALAGVAPPVSSEATEAARGLVGSLPGSAHARSLRITKLAVKLDRLRTVAAAASGAGSVARAR